MNGKNQTCSRYRILGNAGMAAGFLLLCLSVGFLDGDGGMVLAVVGGGLFAAAFLEKMFLWRCPRCGCYLSLCAARSEQNCPCCGAPVKNQ